MLRIGRITSPGCPNNTAVQREAVRWERKRNRVKYMHVSFMPFLYFCSRLYVRVAPLKTIFVAFLLF